MRLPIQIRSFIPILLLSGCLLAQSTAPRIFINEFQASNKTTIEDADFYAYSDWIEVFNTEDTTVQLSGLYLTDDFTNPLKWQIPAGISIQPGAANTTTPFLGLTPDPLFSLNSGFYSGQQIITLTADSAIAI